MGKRWWQGALGVQVCPPAHARLNPRWACFRHGDVGKKRKKKQKNLSSQGLWSSWEKQCVGRDRKKQNNEARSLTDKVDGGTHIPTLDSEERRHM